jgi:predicted DNA-binding protein YlxM (UPF0122 family)
MEKRFELSMLLSLYGAFLTEKQRVMMEQSVNEDFSLSEIAEQESISRQAVRDALKRSEALLYGMEEKLGLMRKGAAARRTLEKLLMRIDACGASASDKANMRSEAMELSNIWEDAYGV